MCLLSFFFTTHIPRKLGLCVPHEFSFIYDRILVRWETLSYTQTNLFFSKIKNMIAMLATKKVSFVIELVAEMAIRIIKRAIVVDRATLKMADE